MDENRITSGPLRITSVDINNDKQHLCIKSSWFRLRNDDTESKDHWIWDLFIGDSIMVNGIIFMVYDITISDLSMSISASTSRNPYRNLRDISKLLGKYIEYKI